MHDISLAGFVCIMRRRLRLYQRHFGVCGLGWVLSLFAFFGEEDLFDMTIKTILDHVLGPVREKLLNHLPFCTEVSVNINNNIVFLRSEAISGGFLENFMFVLDFTALGSDQWIVE